MNKIRNRFIPLNFSVFNFNSYLPKNQHTAQSKHNYGSMYQKTCYLIHFIFIILILSSCSSGKNALQKGDYFSALHKAVDRLKTSPGNSKAISVLKEGYPMAMEWTQEEIDLALSSNSAFKWEGVIHLMNQVNYLSDEIRSTPAARKIISNPKYYTSEIDIAQDKAAEARYKAGLVELEQNTKESGRYAFDHFTKANQYVPNYKDSGIKQAEAKSLATYTVILETIPVNTVKYRLTSEFFYNQLFEYVNRKYTKNSFVQFYSPNQAETLNLKYPDFIVRMEFFDFSVGNVVRTEKEEKLEKRIEIETKDTTKVEYHIYTAKLKTYTDKVISSGTLRFNIVEFGPDKLMVDQLIPGSFTWVNQYGIFVGDKDALNNNQLGLVKGKAIPPPPDQQLFIELTKPIYEQTTSKIDRFFKRYS